MTARPFLCALTAVACSTAFAAPVRSGHAEASLIASESSYRPGQPLQTAIQLSVDEGWHTYWINPGETGMRISVKWELPDGWAAGEPAHPFPKSFTTGGLPGYGYEGTLLLPVTLTPPADAKGEATLKVTVSWLTCNDSACVPGKAELQLNLSDAEGGPSPHAEAIAAAAQRVPRSSDDWQLEVAERENDLTLTLAAPSGSDPSAFVVFPETLQALDDSTPVRFSNANGSWQAVAKKSEYASGPLTELAVVIDAKDGHPPRRVEWRATPKN